MILRRFGKNFESVEVDFDARAMTEIGFRRDHTFSIPTEEFETGYTRVEGAELTAAASGTVQDEAEQAVLDGLRSELSAFEARGEEGDLVVVESQQGLDYPKTREERRNIIVEGANRFAFHWQIDPPLKVGRYRRAD